MRDLKAWLKEGDPLDAQPGLSADDARVMRQVIVAAANGTRVLDWAWPRAWVLATAVAFSLAIGIGIGTQLPSRTRPEAATHPQTIERRQIQFETPGGTRIIWVLNPDFSL